MQKQVSYQTINTYDTLNTLTEKTKYVWFVCHGIGYLSRYFLKYFKELPPSENYIIAPQAPAKYYLNNEYRHIGASWLTKENTQTEISNVLSYLDEVYIAEKLPEHTKLIVFGYSQGVSIAMRWVAQRKIVCDKFILHSGAIPNELTAEQFSFLDTTATEILFIVGDKDEYITTERMTLETEKMETLFYGKAKQLIFKGKHEVKKKIINSLV